MSSDLQLRSHIEDELSWEPGVNAAAIGVSVTDAVVTLSGQVDSFREKHAAEEAVMRIHGVRALANELEVRLPADSVRRDEDIARTAASILLWNASVPKDRIKAQVSQGWITLEGTVDWHYQRMAADLAVQHLMGVRGVINLIAVKQAPSRSEVKSRINAALKRSAELNSQRIEISVHGDKVILSGKVSSLGAKQAAENAAWNAPGILSVQNELTVEPLINSRASSEAFV